MKIYTYINNDNEIYRALEPNSPLDRAIVDQPSMHHKFNLETMSWECDLSSTQDKILVKLANLIDEKQNNYDNEYSTAERSYWTQLEQDATAFLNKEKLDKTSILKTLYSSATDKQLTAIAKTILDKAKKRQEFLTNLVLVKMKVKDLLNLATSIEDCVQIENSLASFFDSSLEEVPIEEGDIDVSSSM
jgi:hypothetical protein